MPREHYRQLPLRLEARSCATTLRLLWRAPDVQILHDLPLVERIGGGHDDAGSQRQHRDRERQPVAAFQRMLHKLELYGRIAGRSSKRALKRLPVAMTACPQGGR
jgi:hypothetical protein